jgi:hypothetical protein
MFGHATPSASVCQSVLGVGCAGMTDSGDGLKADAKASTRRADTGTAALPGLSAAGLAMAATEIRAMDQQAANSGGAHFSEGDFLRHALMMPPM